MNGLRTWIEINQDHFNHNIAQYKRIIGERNLSVVVKANAYGHCIATIAQLAQENSNIHSLCVSSVQEALAIREAGISKPIMLTSVLDGDPTCILGKNVSLTVYDFQTAEYVQQIAKKHHAIIPVHIKIDTGLSRLGADSDEVVALVREVTCMQNLHLEGVYSHCSESHKEYDAFTLMQVDRFRKSIAELKQCGYSWTYTHFANSAATTSLDLPFCNLFRVGIGGYGLWPSSYNKMITQKKYPGFDLKPILTWKTRIRAIKQVKKGSFIGYDRTFQAQEDMKIASIPIGYYDGYDFRLFNKSFVMVRGINAPIVGRISMNMSTIDISHIPNASLDDEVVLMSRHQTLHPAELGVLAGNPNVREMTTKINSNISRIVVHDQTFDPQSEQEIRRHPA